MLASQMKSSSYVRCLIDKQRQFSVGCQHYMHTHTHLMSPVFWPLPLAQLTRERCRILRLHNHSCNLITDMGMHNETCVQYVLCMASCGPVSLTQWAYKTLYKDDSQFGHKTTVHCQSRAGDDVSTCEYISTLAKAQILARHVYI